MINTYALLKITYLIKMGLPITAVLRNAGIRVSKSHPVAWKFPLLLIH